MTWNKSLYGSKTCKGCTDRWVDIETGENCHGSCDKYKALKSKTGAVKQAKHKAYGEICDYTRARRNKV